MGRVKDHFHEEICSQAERSDAATQEPSELELLEMDYLFAKERYERAIRFAHLKEEGK